METGRPCPRPGLGRSRALAELLLPKAFSALGRGWKKPDPRHLVETIARAGGEASRAALIGDTVSDREAARAAGIPCVLVGFGPEGGAVAALRPEAIVADFADLPAVLGRLVPA